MSHIVFLMALLDGLNSIRRSHDTWRKMFSGTTTETGEKCNQNSFHTHTSVHTFRFDSLILPYLAVFSGQLELFGVHVRG